jgi:hypothetical protein
VSQECVIQTKLRNLDMIKRAVTEIGWRFCEGPDRVRYYMGAGELCDHTIKFDGPDKNLSSTYSIGLKQNQDGTWAVRIDNSIQGAVISKEGVYGGQTPRILAQIKSGYAKQAVMTAARQQRGRVKDMGQTEYKGRKKRLFRIEI